MRLERFRLGVWGLRWYVYREVVIGVDGVAALGTADVDSSVVLVGATDEEEETDEEGVGCDVVVGTTTEVEDSMVGMIFDDDAVTSIRTT